MAINSDRVAEKRGQECPRSRQRRPQFLNSARVGSENPNRITFYRSAGFRACGFWRLSSRQFPHGNTGLEAEARPAIPVNPQTGMSALQPLAPAAPPAISYFGFNPRTSIESGLETGAPDFGDLDFEFNSNFAVELRCARSAGFPACGFWRLSSRQFPHGNTGLESPVNPQTGMSALQVRAQLFPS